MWLGQINSNRPIKIDLLTWDIFIFVFFDPRHRQNAKFHISVIKVRIVRGKGKKKFSTFSNRKHVSLDAIVNDEGFSFATDNRSFVRPALSERAKLLEKKGILIVARALEGAYYGNCFVHRNHYV